MSILTTKTLATTDGSVEIPVKELTTRVIQRHEAPYTGGIWNPDNSYNWAPGSFVDFTPLRADSRISYIWRAPHSRFGGTTHAISHWRFYVNGVIYFYHGMSGRHIENGNVMKWDVPSWGTSQARIGYQIRSYANDNHETRVYSTDYWDGGGTDQNAHGQLIVEEYAGTDPGIEPVRSPTWTAK